VLQRVFVRGLGAGWGLTVGALLFAILHYLKVPPNFEPSPVTAADGWRAVGAAFGPILGFGWAQARFVLLVGIGLVLGLAAWRTGRLWLPIGLHAGWVVGLKLGQKLTEEVPGHWASGDFASNPLSFAALVGVGLIVWNWPRSSPT
jgi:membrane protease YdiL (CAAX protease family)